MRLARPASRAPLRYAANSTSVKDFKELYWKLLRTAIETHSASDARTLLQCVPNPIQAGFMQHEPSRRTPLHYCVIENFKSPQRLGCRKHVVK